jgi:small nuclear ribonucleoprotein (snRNP)-like protein
MDFGSTGLDPKYLLDKEISIITNSNIRYEGVLVHIDEATQKLTLRGVR